MLLEQRHRLIVQRLSQFGSVSIAELTEELGVSRETIRRDIDALAGDNRLRKTRGGAIALGPIEPDEAHRRTLNSAGKRAIGQMAGAMVPDGAVVILDSGTTTRCAADALLARRGLTVYSNDIRIALKLARRNDNRVILLGGEVQQHEDATQGLDTIDMLTRYLADFAFVGAGAITPEGDLTDYSREASALRGRMLVSARIAVVVADHMKFERTTPVRVPNFDHATHVITDAAPEPRLRSLLEGRGTKVVVAREARAASAEDNGEP